VLLLAACGPEAGHGALDEVAATTEVTTTAAATTPPTTPPAAPAPTTPAPTPAASPTPVRVAVPAVTGMTASRATAALTAAGLRWTTATLRTSRYAAGTVVSVSPGAGARLARGTVVTVTVAQAPPVVRTTPPRPVPPPTAAPSNCDPSYPDVCLKTGIGDYDCAGGSGNGPNYVRGPIRVLPPDPFDLDHDGNGIGCE